MIDHTWQFPYFFCNVAPGRGIVSIDRMTVREQTVTTWTFTIWFEFHFWMIQEIFRFVQKSGMKLRWLNHAIASEKNEIFNFEINIFWTFLNCWRCFHQWGLGRHAGSWYASWTQPYPKINANKILATLFMRFWLICRRKMNFRLVGLYDFCSRLAFWKINIFLESTKPMANATNNTASTMMRIISQVAKPNAKHVEFHFVLNSSF